MNKLYSVIGIPVLLLLEWGATMPRDFAFEAMETGEVGFTFSNDARHLTLGLLPDEDRYYSQGLHIHLVTKPSLISYAPRPTR